MVKILVRGEQLEQAWGREVLHQLGFQSGRNHQFALSTERVNLMRNIYADNETKSSPSMWLLSYPGNLFKMVSQKVVPCTAIIGKN